MMPAPILTLLHKALSHDLPNHLLANNGMAKLLELEAGDRLGEARQYLDRLTAAGLRCHEALKELADAVRLVNLPPAAEPIALAEAVRDSIEAVRPHVPNLVVEVSFAEDALTARLPAAVLRFVVSQALRLIEATPLRIASRADPGGTILQIGRCSPDLEAKLALAASVLACHGGRLEVESHERLRLWLPG
jgi:hypothetical protein